VHVFQTLKHLIDNVLLVNIFENVGPNDSVQISVHKVENEVDVTVIFGANHVLKSDYIFVSSQLL
jgi:hypothetical protein